VLINLERFGFVFGKEPRWCAACNREFHGGVKAFKCQSCAVKQRREVERECDEAGINEE
jgi:hypothetical protein